MRRYVVLSLVIALVTIGAATATAVDVGQPAPDFKLASTTGSDIGLSDFKGKQWVFLEFYGGDFAPT